MAISKLDFTSLMNKTSGSTLGAVEWNTFVRNIAGKTNEIIDALGDGGGSSAQTTEGFYVNNTLVEPENGVVALQAEDTYVLRGMLRGRILIGIDGDTGVSADTHVILDGVTIITDNEINTGLCYQAESKKVNITLAANKSNVIICSHSAQREESQKGALHSSNNMIVQGNGYLSIINNGGHGIKASELSFVGRPHIYVSAIHDAFHGNKKTVITDGYYVTQRCNDAFGSSADSNVGAGGTIHIFGGNFSLYGVAEQAFDAKAEGGLKIYNPFHLDTDAGFMPSAGVALTSDDKDIDGLFSETGTVKVGGVAVSPVNGVYDISTKEASVEVSGYVEGRIVLSNTKIKVTLNNAFIKAKGGPAVSYTPGSSKLCIVSAKDTINAIVQADVFVSVDATPVYAAVSSANNLEIETKSGSLLYVTSLMGSGIEASEITRQDGTGSIIVSDCGGCGIKGSAINFEYSGTKLDYNNIGSTIALNNADGDIVARISSSGKKSTVTVNTEELEGVIAADHIKIHSGNSTSGADFGYSKKVFYGRFEGRMRGRVPATREFDDVIRL